MRSLFAMSMAGLLTLAVAAPAAAGPNVGNTSGSGRVVEGGWGSQTGSGAIYLFDESTQDYGELFEESGEWVECGDNGTPDDPEDDSWGFVGQRLYGYFWDVRISMTSKLSKATATATGVIFSESVNDCAFQAYDTTPSDPVTVTVSLTGTGPVAMFRGMGSFRIPSDYNSHSSYRGKERQAVGSVDLGTYGARTFDWAVMAEYSWIDHTNS